MDAHITILQTAARGPDGSVDRDAAGPDRLRISAECLRRITLKMLNHRARQDALGWLSAADKLAYVGCFYPRRDNDFANRTIGRYEIDTNRSMPSLSPAARLDPQGLEDLFVAITE